LWGPEAQKSQLREFKIRTGIGRRADIIRSATVTCAALLMQEGKLGTIAAGACADLLIADGDPHLGVMLDPDKNLKFVMKDGIIYKNELN
jgi:imidazolonepropionase-like amidohydrolase